MIDGGEASLVDGTGLHGIQLCQLKQLFELFHHYEIYTVKVLVEEVVHVPPGEFAAERHHQGGKR